MKKMCVLAVVGFMMMSGMAQAALTNDFSDISGFTTAIGWPTTGVTLTQQTDSFQMDLTYQSWETTWYSTPASAIWTLDGPYNFSGKDVSVEARSVTNIGRATIELYSNGTRVWAAWDANASNFPAVGSSWTTISGTVPEGSAFESINQIRFWITCGAGAPDPGSGSGSAQFRNFVSTAVPEPCSMVLLTTAIGLGFIRQRRRIV
jgi:FlaG/FlaF family flagellin (archaellin)